MQPTSNQDGHILLFSMLVLTIIFLSTFHYLNISYNTKTDSLLSHHKLQAYYAAEAGIEMVLTRLKRDSNWQRWSADFAEPLPYAGGTIKIIKVWSSSYSEEQQEIEIEVQGTYQRAQKTLIVHARLDKEPDGTVKQIDIIRWEEKYPVF